jgi:hypothetical protein
MLLSHLITTSSSYCCCYQLALRISMASAHCSYIVDLPSLIQSSVLLPDQNVLVVSVLSSSNFQHESSFVHDVLALQLEVLMPDILLSNEVRISSSSLITDVKRCVGISLWLDASSFRVEDEHLVIVVSGIHISNDNIVT